MGCGGSLPMDAAALEAARVVDRANEKANDAFTFSTSPLVELSYGTVRGCRDHAYEPPPTGVDKRKPTLGPITPGLEVFKNIPYAKAERLGLAGPPDSWRGVLDAVAFGPDGPNAQRP